jgi:uncharacterized protein YjbJ (UPF0337 family)
VGLVDRSPDEGLQLFACLWEPESRQKGANMGPGTKMKSGKRDQVEGAPYKFGGRVLEAVGSLTGDRKKKVKGRLGRGKGTAKDGEGRLMGLFKN